MATMDDAVPLDDAAAERGLDALLTSGLRTFERPGAELDPYLDAFAVVVQRFGVGRTRVQDVARELGVDRTTVFRNAGSMDTIIQSYLGREVHRFFDALLDDVPDDLDGPDLVVEIVASSVERARRHPVLAKAIADEPDLVARLAYANLGALVTHVQAVVAAGLALLAELGLVAVTNGEVVGDWIARIGITSIVEPPDDLRASLSVVLDPLLTL